MCFRRPFPTMMAAILWACLATSLETASGQGFKKLGQPIKVDLTRRLPPKLILDGTRICVQADTATSGIGRLSGASRALAKSLKTTLESALLESDTRLTANCVEPQTMILCTIVLLEVNKNWQTGKSSKKTGWKKLWEESSNKEQRYLRYNGSATVSYQARDTRTGKTVDSGNFNAHFEDHYADGIDAPSDMQVAQTLMGNAVQQIAVRMVPVDQKIEVWLARGKLDKISKTYGKTQTWPQMLEILETMAPFPKRKDDAYRHYNIGVAYEALAYQAEDLQVAGEHLQNASIHYGRALQMKPSEKYFVGPQKRIEEALVLNKGLIERQRALAEAAGQPAVAIAGSKRLEFDANSGASPASAPASPQAEEDVLTNRDVIALHKAKMDSKSLIDYINTYPRVSFDTSPDGMLSLYQNQVPSQVVNAMRKRQESENN